VSVEISGLFKHPLNDHQFGGEDPWEQFLTSVEKSDPPIRALGIADQKAKEQRRVAAENSLVLETAGLFPFRANLPNEKRRDEIR
jgi:hypothetical protein